MRSKANTTAKRSSNSDPKGNVSVFSKIIDHISLVLFYSVATRLPSSTMPMGRLYKKIRYSLASRLIAKCGNNVNIENGCFFGRGDKLEVGDYSGIGVNARIYGAVNIGKYVMMGPDVIIMTANHCFNDINVPMCLQGHEKEKPVTIDDDVWIGARAIILPGVRIGKGCIIGAGAVVTKSFEPYSIIGGVPAKLLKKRS